MQSQMRDILAKRLEAYPRLWSVVQTHVSDWRIEKKTVDKSWASSLLSKLMQCHSEFGVLFSEPVYKGFFELRDAMIEIGGRFEPGEPVTPDSLAALDVIWSTRLAPQMKDDLGSYVIPASRRGG